MVLTKFYDLINDELSEVLSKNATDVGTKKHKEIALNKGYALLIWFLEFYGQKSIYKSFITDGNDDSCCDVIFLNKNVQDEDVFYIIQSKYISFDSSKKQERDFPKIDNEEFAYALNSFNIILSGERTLGKNENFNEKYKELKTHLERNGKAKFIFFTLASLNANIQDAVNAFNKINAPNVSIEVIDIEKIRRDYIEFKFKGVTTFNPLEYTYSAEHNTIELEIERYEENTRDIFEYKGRAQAYTFLLAPKTIHSLFKKYQFSLFFKNVRNPIHRSNYNAKIVETLLKKPDSFWYFNNGITAITKLPSNIGIHAKKIPIRGLQVINGAQTVYSVYLAYENAKIDEREAMDVYARVALRLISSSDEEFNLQITRYTNMQNPMYARDFFANDDVQQRLQNESFATNLWYEKRGDEFQLSEAQKEAYNIEIIRNQTLVEYYVAFHLQKPHLASRSKDFFVSKTENPDGLYEEIFNSNTNFEDIFAAWFVFRELNFKGIEDLFGDGLSLALSKVIIEKYFAAINHSEKELNVTKYIIKLSKSIKKSEIDEFRKILKYTKNLVTRFYHNALTKSLQNIFYHNAATLIEHNANYYLERVKYIEEHGINIEEIQSIKIDE